MRVPPVFLSALLAAIASLLPAPGAASREAVVYLVVSGFAPASLAVSIGDRVRFTVRDHKAHQLAKTSGPPSGDVAPNVLDGQGASVTLMPDEPGTYAYIDRLNPKHAEFRLSVRR